MSTGRRKKKAKKKAGRRATGKAARGPAKKTARTRAGKKTGRRPARKTGKKARQKTRTAPAGSALKRLQPELETALSRLLGRVQRKLDRLPHTSQLKLLELEAGGYTYTLSRLRPPPDDSLTHRQKQIARLVAQGISNKEIAAKLRISPATVAAHLRTIFTKLRLKTRTALAKHAIAYYG